MKKLYDKYKIYIIKFLKYLTRDEFKPYEDKIKKIFKDTVEKSTEKEFSRKRYAISPKKNTTWGLKIFIAFASFFIALISFPLVFLLGPFWVVVYLSLGTSVLYSLYSNVSED